MTAIFHFHSIVEGLSVGKHMLVTQFLKVPGSLVAHSTRSLATSWAALKWVALTDICAAASWSSPCTFTRYYRVNVVDPVTLGSTILLSAAKQGCEEGEAYIPL